MLVQRFSPSTSTTTITNSPFSLSSSSSRLSSSLTKNPTTSILSPFLNSESTGFQPTTNQNIHMDYGDQIKTHLSACPRKLKSVMEIHQQRFSQLNPRFKQQQQRITANLYQPIQQSVMCPIILPAAYRPQPRQQARPKHQQQTQFPPASTTRRSDTAHAKQPQPASASNPQYITLANLTKILHVLQTNEKISDSEISTDTSASTSNTSKPRVQQHLQETATRWWKPTRSSASQPPVPAPSSIHTYATAITARHLPSSASLQQQSDNLPLLTIVSNSTRQLYMSSTNDNGDSKYDASESSTEVQTTVITSITQTTNTNRTRQEPLIMQARGMRLHSHDHPSYSNHNNKNFFQQQRLIRQT